MKKLLFNSSMPRSGSELLQVILHQNPLIYASATSPLLEYQFAARGNYGLPEVRSQNPQLMQDAFISMCGGMAQAYYAPITERPYVIDKNRGWLHYFEWVEQWCPEPKMICMVRDLRSVIASMERIYRTNRHDPQGIDDPSKMENMTLEDRATHWLNKFPVGLALARLYDCVVNRKLSNKILVVRLEDMVSAPTDTFERIYHFLGIAPHVHAFDNIVKSVEEDDSHYGIFGRHSVARKLKNCVPWQETLSARVGESIVHRHGWFFNSFNYQ